MNFTNNCLNIDFEEIADNRWYSHFDELPKIDQLIKSGKNQKALNLSIKSLKKYPDSFLFYLRIAQIYETINEADKSKEILMDGLLYSKSKCNICTLLGDMEFSKGDNKNAVMWWIRACYIQIKADIYVDTMPFLNLAYILQPYSLKNEEAYLLKLADESSSQGPVRLNSSGAEKRYQIARQAMSDGDDEIVEAIQALCQGDIYMNKDVNSEDDKNIEKKVISLLTKWWSSYSKLDSSESDKMENEIISFGKKAVSPLLSAATDSEQVFYIRQRAIYILGKIGDSSVVETLFNEFVKARNPKEMSQSDPEAFGLYRETLDSLKTMGYEVG